MGPAVTPDSVAYREVALNILHGYGPVNNQGQLVNHWPPLYPAVLALSAFITGLTIQSSALLLQGALCFLYLMLLFRIGRQCQLPPLSRMLLVLLVCLLPGMFNFSRQMSEGLFNTLLLALLSLGMDYEQHPRPMLMGFLAGLLFLNRYAGMAFVAGTGLFILIAAFPRPERMILRASLFALTPTIMMGGWMLTEQLMHAGHFNRVTVFHAIPAYKWMSLSEQVNTQIFPPVQWLFPYSGVIFLGLFIGISAYWIWRRKGKINVNPFVFIWMCFCAFLMLLFITCMYLDAHTPMDARIWSPAAPLMLILLLLMLQDTSGKLRSVYLLFLIVFNIIPAYARWSDFRKNGEGLSARAWRESPTLKAAATAVQSGKKVYSNGADILNYYWNESGRFRVYATPMKYYPTSGVSNSGFERENVVMLDEIKQQKAVLVYFHHIRWRKFLEDSAGLAKRLQGKTPETYRDGLILW
ncbi:MAG: hypothetical protein KJS92_01050 [Bacteroidetes bacterium]|nr:hypothetical protein [Bacteroidota bacterium]